MKVKCVAQAQTTKKLTLSKAFDMSRNQSYRSLILFFYLCHKIFPFPSILPTPFVELLRFDHPWRPHPRGISAATLPLLVLSKASHRRTIQRWHECNRPLTCNILRYQGEHRRTNKLVTAIFHSDPPSLETLRCLLLFLLSSLKELGWKPSHHSLVFAMYNIDTLFKKLF